MLTGNFWSIASVVTIDGSYIINSKLVSVGANKIPFNCMFCCHISYGFAALICRSWRSIQVHLEPYWPAPIHNDPWDSKMKGDARLIVHVQPLTKKISLNPLRTSRTTFLIWGTSLKILSGRRQRSIISSWAPDSGGTSGGSQHRKIRLTYSRHIALWRWAVSGKGKYSKDHKVAISLFV